MIQYLIIVGLQDSNLSERLQIYPELNLDKAITMARLRARRREAVREQQAVVRSETDNTCTRIEEVDYSYFNEKTTNCVPSQQYSKKVNKKGCARCSKFPMYPSAWLVKLHVVSVKSKATISV